MMPFVDQVKIFRGGLLPDTANWDPLDLDPLEIFSTFSFFYRKIVFGWMSAGLRSDSNLFSTFCRHLKVNNYSPVQANKLFVLILNKLFA
jgi:hypothetical protein